jgi:hypothetical protein
VEVALVVALLVVAVQVRIGEVNAYTVSNRDRYSSPRPCCG